MGIKFLVILVIALNWSSVSLAKKKSGKARAYSFFVDGNKTSQGECDSERKIPSRMKRLGDLKKSKEYLGSEAMEANGNEESWKHFFSSQAFCNEKLRQLSKVN